ncbi:MAG: heat-inducible transcriptional repressor HrcA [Solirubrobacteraceae bacterium MAG38_C4-C5]|nr:heat-inducible transcriptional repressor HrcA [Candidatus Siliceabacter maunaloa]
MVSPRQGLILRKVVEGYLDAGAPVGSKSLAGDPELGCGPSTIRSELAVLEEQGLVAHPHTSAGRVPTDAGYRFFVDRLLVAPVQRERTFELSLVRGEIDAAMRATTETLSQVTNLLALVTAPPIETATIRHVEVLVLQPQVLMVVVITSTGGVTKRMFTFEGPVDRGLVAWAAEYLNEQLVGLGLGARMLARRLADPALTAGERAFLDELSPAFLELAATADETLYVDGTARLLSENRLQDLSQIHDLVGVLERRVTVLEVLRAALGARDVVVRIGAELELPALGQLALVGATYGLTHRPLGTVSVLGPVRMDYGVAIATVREAALQLSRYVTDAYDEA